MCGRRPVGGIAQFVDESPERQAAVRLVAARQFGKLEHVGQHLLAAAPQYEAGVRPCHLDQPAHRLGHRPMVPQPCQLAQRAQGLGDGDELGRHVVRHVEGPEAAVAGVPRQ